MKLRGREKMLEYIITNELHILFIQNSLVFLLPIF